MGESWLCRNFNIVLQNIDHPHQSSPPVSLVVHHQLFGPADLELQVIVVAICNSHVDDLPKQPHRDLVEEVVWSSLFVVGMSFDMALTQLQQYCACLS